MSFFITDAVSDDFEHVYVVLEQLDLLTTSGTVSIHRAAQGAPMVVDLMSRGGATQRSLFVATATVPAGQYTGVRVVMDQNLMLVPTGSTQGTPAVFADSQGGQKTLALGFDAPRGFSGGESLVIDFDLATWELQGGVVTTTADYIRFVDPAGVMVLANHEPNDLEGVITALTGPAPNQRFILDKGTGQVPVAVGPDSALYHELGHQGALIAEGIRVEVTGIFDPAQGVLLADEIKVEDDDIPDAEVRGTVVGEDIQTATFSVLEEVEAFVPQGTALTIRSVAGTVFLTRRGVPMEDYFHWVDLLAVSGRLEAEGELDPVTQTLTPHRVKLIGPAVDEKYNELEGPVSNIDVAALSFTVAAEEWWGLNVGVGEPITVDLTDTYYYRVDRYTGEEETAVQFFAALTVGQRVEVEGRFNAVTRTFRARWAAFEPEWQDQDDLGFEDDGATPIDDPTGP